MQYMKLFGEFCYIRALHTLLDALNNGIRKLKY